MAEGLKYAEAKALKNQNMNQKRMQEKKEGGQRAGGGGVREEEKITANLLKTTKKAKSVGVKVNYRSRNSS